LTSNSMAVLLASNGLYRTGVNHVSEQV